MEGRLADAEQLISDTLALGRRSQSWNAVVSQRFALFVLRRAQGRLAEFEDTLKRSAHEYPPLIRFRCSLAHTYGELGRKHDASAVLDELMTHDLGNEHVDAEWLLSLTCSPIRARPSKTKTPRRDSTRCSRPTRVSTPWPR